MPLDGAQLGAALGLPVPLKVHRELCGVERGVFDAAIAQAAGEVESLTVACTQEAPLFAELAAGSAHAAVPLRFVNIRETAGWSAEAPRATPKIAALIAMAQLPDPAPVQGVSYNSAGTALIIGDAAAAIAWAERLTGKLDVCVLMTGGTAGAELPARRRYPVLSGKPARVSGWLGSFEAEWQSENPIDLAACTRCNACVDACPEGAISLAFQVDADKCRAHRACVKACGEVGAIDFSRGAVVHKESFDLVLDLSRTPLLRLHQLPQGYFAPGDDPLAQALAVAEMAELVGEFEKPRYFAYNPRTCAHSRSAKPGCNQCIDVCSTAAIAADGDHVRVEPHLCMGCGACSTVCPSGAMTFAYPAAPEIGTRLKTLLKTFHGAGGREALILLHDESGLGLIERAGRSRTGGAARQGLPARVLPLALHHVASAGIDLWLAALAYGASEVRVLLTGAEAPEYAAAITRQAAILQAIVAGLGYGGEHVGVINAETSADWRAGLWSATPAQAVAKAATFNVAAEKRQTLEFAIEHLARHAPVPAVLIELPVGAPFGTIAVDRSTCTLCLACVGACPAAALSDNADTPQLRFLERNCVQCGLCVATCPENSISLLPRLNLDESARKPQVLNEAEPFHCVRCSKPFGTRQMIDNMSARLSAHSMFAGGSGLRRLQMCADCRVVDMMENPAESTIHDVRK
jgi:ferredoxin